MVRAAVAIGWELAAAGERGVGDGVLAAVAAARRHAAANTNLGIALLLVPLARAALTGAHGTLRQRLAGVLATLDVQDARRAYEAIRLAGAGGLHQPVAHDVREAPTVTLGEAMAAAAARDRIAAEYTSDFAVTFELGLPTLRSGLAAGLRVRDAIVELYLTLLAQLPDTLIARRRGMAAAQRVSSAAAAALEAGGVRSPAGRRALARMDASLRTPDNALNPGTTADLVAGVLFVALLEGAL